MGKLTLSDSQSVDLLIVSNVLPFAWYFIAGTIIQFVFIGSSIVQSKNTLNKTVNYLIQTTTLLVPVMTVIINYANAYINKKETSLIAAASLTASAIVNLVSWGCVIDIGTLGRMIVSTVTYIITAFSIQGVSGRHGHFGHIPVYAFNIITVVTEVTALLSVTIEFLFEFFRHENSSNLPTITHASKYINEVCENDAIIPSVDEEERLRQAAAVAERLRKTIKRNRNKCDRVKCVSLYVCLCTCYPAYIVGFILSAIATSDLTGKHKVAMGLNIASMLCSGTLSLIIAVYKIQEEIPECLICATDLKILIINMKLNIKEKFNERNVPHVITLKDIIHEATSVTPQNNVTTKDYIESAYNSVDLNKVGVTSFSRLIAADIIYSKCDNNPIVELEMNTF